MQQVLPAHYCNLSYSTSLYSAWDVLPSIHCAPFHLLRGMYLLHGKDQKVCCRANNHTTPVQSNQSIQHCLQALAELPHIQLMRGTFEQPWTIARDGDQ